MYTEEQLEIIHCNDNIIEVDSVAGSGKTTTLIGYAKEHFNKSILCLMFNKDLRIGTKRKMPVNVEVHTINSFAFAYSKYKKRQIVDSLTLFDIEKYSQSKTKEESLLYFNAYKDYCTTGIKNELSEIIINYMKKNFVKIDQDFILVEMLNSLESFDYDIVMVDEAQDINPVMKKIVENINKKKLIIVGDKNQAIYGFRKNISLFNMDNSSKFSLKKTFRFGPEIANYINRLSIKLYGEEIGMIGNENIESILTNEDLLGGYTAYISRTNKTLINNAIEFALSDINISIPFDWEEFNSDVNDVIYLKLGLMKQIRNRNIKMFKSYSEFKNIIKSGYLKEMSYIVSLIEEHDIFMKEYLQIIGKNLTPVRYADIVFLTAHKSKGLEYLNVNLSDDFNFKNTEEKNLIYVASTRAIKKLNPYKGDLICEK